MTKTRKNPMMVNNYNRYLESNYGDNLFRCYERPSERKWNALEYCKNLMRKCNGWGLKIISYNTKMFTVGFKFADEETGALCFAYITKDYERYCEL